MHSDPRRAGRAAVALAVLALGAAATTACGSSSATTASTGSPATRTTTGTATGTPSGTATTSRSGATTGTTASAGGSTASTTPRHDSTCTGIKSQYQGRRQEGSTWTAALQLSNCTGTPLTLEAYPSVTFRDAAGTVVPVTVKGSDPVSGLTFTRTSPVCLYITWTPAGTGPADAVTEVTVRGAGARPAVTDRTFQASLAKGSPVSVHWAASSGECLGSN